MNNCCLLIKISDCKNWKYQTEEIKLYSYLCFFQNYYYCLPLMSIAAVESNVDLLLSFHLDRGYENSINAKGDSVVVSRSRNCS